MNRLNLATCAVLTLMALGAGNTRAANALVTWQTPGTISGSNDVSLFGSLLYADNMGGPFTLGKSVNGVNFQPLRANGTASSFSDASGDITVTAAGTNKPNGSPNFGGVQNPFASMPIPYRDLLSTGVYSRGGLTLQLNQLVPNQTYLVEIWANYTNASSPVSSTFNAETVGAGNSTSLNFNSSHLVGGTGQFVTGTFTATGATEQIALAGTFSQRHSPFSLVNAVQVRTLSVPEPSSFALLGSALAFAGLMRVRLRRFNHSATRKIFQNFRSCTR